MPFRCMIVGVSASGKSTLLRRILRYQMPGKFNWVYCICPSVQQPLWQEIKTQFRLNPKRISDEASCAQFQKFYDEAKQLYEKKQQRSLIILDDVVHTDVLSYNSPIHAEITRMRHNFVSIILLTQYYKSVLPVLRSNVDKMIVFYNPSNIESRKMIEEFGPDFARFYEQIKAIPRAYITVNRDVNASTDKRYQIVTDTEQFEETAQEKMVLDELFNE